MVEESKGLRRVATAQSIALRDERAILKTIFGGEVVVWAQVDLQGWFGIVGLKGRQAQKNGAREERRFR
jgi:hypothetical protein